MNIEFDNTALEELYTNGATKDHQYKRLSKDIINSSPDGNGIIVNALLFEISKHYE